MSRDSGWRPGRWKAVCDRCGFRYHSDKLKREWDGLMVCQPCWETRNPQDFLKVPPERIVPPWTRPEPADNIPLICYLWAVSAYADLAEADCARADVAVLPYIFLADLKGEPYTLQTIPTPPPSGGGFLFLDGDGMLLDDMYISFGENSQIFLDTDYILLDSDFIGLQ